LSLTVKPQDAYMRHVRLITDRPVEHFLLRLFLRDADLRILGIVSPFISAMEKYVREGRNYGLSFVVATQQPTAIDPRILAQVDTLIVHKLTVQGDIDYIRKNIKSSLPEEVKYGNSILNFDELIRSLEVGQALVSNTETDRAFVMDVRPRISVHGGF
jgi:hypothetical protein